MTPSPHCLRCDAPINPEEAIFVVVEGQAIHSPRTCEASWVCNHTACLEWLTKAAEEEKCSLLQPQGIFDPAPRPDGRPAWLIWISHEKAQSEAEASDLFSVIYRPYTTTAR